MTASRVYGVQTEIPRVLCRYIHSYLDEFDLACMYMVSHVHRKACCDYWKHAFTVYIGPPPPPPVQVQPYSILDRFPKKRKYVIETKMNPLLSHDPRLRFPEMYRVAHEVPLRYATGTIRHAVALWNTHCQRLKHNYFDLVYEEARTRLAIFLKTPACRKLQSFTGDLTSTDSDVLFSLEENTAATLHKLSLGTYLLSTSCNNKENQVRAIQVRAGEEEEKLYRHDVLEDRGTSIYDLSSAVAHLLSKCSALHTLILHGDGFSRVWEHSWSGEIGVSIRVLHLRFQHIVSMGFCTSVFTKGDRIQELYLTVPCGKDNKWWPYFLLTSCSWSALEICKLRLEHSYERHDFRWNQYTKQREDEDEEVENNEPTSSLKKKKKIVLPVLRKFVLQYFGGWSPFV